MILFSGTALFWFIALGLAIGWAFGMIIKKEGIPLWANIMWGTFASVLTGIIGMFFGFGDGLLFALVYTLAFLFIANVFHHHHKEDIKGGDIYSIHVKKR
ncbi:hypothetical protein [Fodinibius salsisoli]|uniref:Uncharacterized protein n=1 Tax=Fodinibius salsisoli TaxID=2820877 RepID=A0ABT3PIT3_9BACT|nr:hypothetical protein [Fodinibius salsisoli]MCW9705841.1 hypothetical protein [Fodinibius salsisoli]